MLIVHDVLQLADWTAPKASRHAPTRRGALVPPGCPFLLGADHGDLASERAELRELAFLVPVELVAESVIATAVMPSGSWPKELLDVPASRMMEHVAQGDFNAAGRPDRALVCTLKAIPLVTDLVGHAVVAW